jgi:two-component system sensor histidine kinase BaeS
MLASLRFRLPLTYAAVALLAVLALGAVLLAVLRDIYGRQELNYLLGNAATIAEVIAPPMSETSTPAGWLQAQAEGLAFLTQTRVRVLGPSAETVLVDSGESGLAGGSTRIAIDVMVGDVAQSFSQSIEQQGDQSTSTFSSSIIVEDQSFSRNVDETTTITGTTDSLLASRLPAGSTLFGFGFDPTATSTLERSDIVVRQPIPAPDGQTLGYIELSEGPAYGRAILRSVARGWGVAALVAAALAAAVGWLISRRITAPIGELTAATRQMAAGQLSIRAASARRDEIGTLTDSFNRMAERIEATVAALRRFVADAAHELHTPLTAIRSDLDLLAETAVGAERARLARLQEQTRRLEHLTTGLLDLSRLEAATENAALEAVDLRDLVRDASEPYASRAEQLAIHFALDLPSSPVIVRGDGGQLRQVVGNLLDNALKFTPAGGAVRLGLTTDGAWADLQVTDTGIGIPAEDRPHLFSRFHRGRNAAPYPGSGLGLAIVKTIVETHGGTVSAASDDGTTVSVRLPSAAPLAAA